MSVTASDIKYKFSVSAAAGNTTAGTAATSLGDQLSTTEITTATLNNLFDDISAAEASAGRTEYRCIFVHQDHATDTAFSVQVSIQSDTAGGSTYTLALDNIGVVAEGSASAQALTIANETTAPSGGAGVGAFGTGPLTIGTMGPNTCAAVWVRRVTAASTAATVTDNATIRVAAEG
jgi:hypothetical protein